MIQAVLDRLLAEPSRGSYRWRKCARPVARALASALPDVEQVARRDALVCAGVLPIPDDASDALLAQVAAARRGVGDMGRSARIPIRCWPRKHAANSERRVSLAADVQQRLAALDSSSTELASVVLGIHAEILDRGARAEFLAAVDESGDPIEPVSPRGRWALELVAAILDPHGTSPDGLPRPWAALRHCGDERDTVRAWVFHELRPKDIALLFLGGRCEGNSALVDVLARVAWSLDSSRRHVLANAMGDSLRERASECDWTDEALALLAIVEPAAARRVSRDALEPRGRVAPFDLQELADQYGAEVTAEERAAFESVFPAPPPPQSRGVSPSELGYLSLCARNARQLGMLLPSSRDRRLLIAAAISDDPVTNFADKPHAVDLTLPSVRIGPATIRKEGFGDLHVDLVALGRAVGLAVEELVVALVEQACEIKFAVELDDTADADVRNETDGLIHRLRNLEAVFDVAPEVVDAVAAATTVENLRSGLLPLLVDVLDHPDLRRRWLGYAVPWVADARLPLDIWATIVDVLETGDGGRAVFVEEPGRALLVAILLRSLTDPSALAFGFDALERLVDAGSGLTRSEAEAARALIMTPAPSSGDYRRRNLHSRLRDALASSVDLRVALGLAFVVENSPRGVRVDAVMVRE